MLLAWVRSKLRWTQNAFRRTGNSRRNSESSEPRAVEIQRNQSSCAPFALGFLHDAATTAPRHPPSFVTRSRVATAHARRRCVQPTSATQIVKDEHPCDRYLSTFPRVSPRGVDGLLGSRRATRFGSSRTSDRGRVVPARSCVATRLWRFVVPRWTTELVGASPRNQERFRRPLVKVGGDPRSKTPSASNRALTSSGTVTDSRPLPFLALFRSKSVNLELDHASQPSRNRASPYDRGATCRFLQVAESTSTPHEPSSLAAAETFSASVAYLIGSEPQSTRGRSPELTLRKRLLCEPSRSQQACAHWRRGRTETRRVPDGQPIPSCEGTWRAPALG